MSNCMITEEKRKTKNQNQYASSLSDKVMPDIDPADVMFQL